MEMNPINNHMIKSSNRLNGFTEKKFLRKLIKAHIRNTIQEII